ncbi:MAG: PaaI family thioesterase [Hyphomonadaceae bacterium]
MAEPVMIDHGPWAGWRTWTHDAFETGSGPFYFQKSDDGTVRCAFRLEKKHLNGGGAAHGGCLMTFADFAVFAIADDVIGSRAVTVNLSGDFLGPAYEGELMEATGEVTRAGGRIIYVRGLITADGKPCLSFTSVITRIKPKT